MVSYKITIDDREKHADGSASLTAEFDRLGIPYTLSRLKCGDILIENIDTKDICVIERKEVSDYCSSIIDGRLNQEIMRMNEHYSKSFLIIEGKFEDYYKKQAKLKRAKFIKNIYGFSSAHKIGSMVSISVRTNTKILMSDSKEETVQMINTIAGKFTDGKCFSAPVFRTHKTEDRIYENLLLSFPTISHAKAERIMILYPTWALFSAAILNKSFKLEGFGQKTVDMFYKSLI
jgi:ERCC4-type nuclease